MIYLLVISLCFIIACLITPYVMKLAYFTNAVDQPNKRKVHSRIIPRMGGLAIYVAFLLGYMIFKVKGYAIDQDEIAFIDAYFIASFLIVATGMLDDMFELPAKPKALVQLVAALIMVLYGNFMIDKIYLPFLPVIDLGWIGGIVTVIWIVGITNSINLIDGLDGLSSGISAISFGTMAILAAYQGEAFVVMMSCLLLGSTLGFLIHNFHPAKIFMGDTGSLFLGFSVSVLSLLGYKNAAFVSFIIPIVMLSVPIFDTIWAIIRRILNGQSPFKPDRGHVHHQLLDRNLGHVKSVLVLYGIAAIEKGRVVNTCNPLNWIALGEALFSFTAILYTMSSKFYGLVMLVIAILVVELVFNTTGLFRAKPKKGKKEQVQEQKEDDISTGEISEK